MFDILEKSIEFGQKLGADVVEARREDLILRTLHRSDDIWKDIQVKSRMGFGITCYVDGVSGFSYTASQEEKDVLDTTEKAFKIAKASSEIAKLKLPFDERDPFKSKKSDSWSVKKHPLDFDLSYKTDLVNRAVETARAHGENIRNIRGLYGELYGTKQFYNSEGTKLDWNFLVLDLRVSVTSKTESGANVMGAESYGGTFGLETYDKDDYQPEKMGKKAALDAKEQLSAKACPAGVFRSLIENELAGVLAHESFGHLSEADFVVTNASPLTGKMNEQLGTENATIIDAGTPNLAKFGGLWVPYDDQGTPASDTIVLDKGVLKHYLHDRGTAQNQNQVPTGNSRAINYIFPPIVRMTNTYFAPGSLNEEEALELLNKGVYAIQSYGGQVEGNGSFLFKAFRGYWVENGEIQYPIREVSLSGNILQLLGKIEGATNDLKIRSGYFGGCGKGKQSPLPVGLGGPKLVVDGVMFGGKTE